MIGAARTMHVAVSPIAMILAAACASGSSAVRGAGDAREEAFAREACGPYFKATSLQPGLPSDVVPVGDAISSRTGTVRGCYLSALAADRDLQGCVAISFAVDDAQRIGAVKSVWNSTSTARLAECVVEALRGIGVVQGARSSEYTKAFVFLLGPS